MGYPGDTYPLSTSTTPTDPSSSYSTVPTRPNLKERKEVFITIVGIPCGMGVGGFLNDFVTGGGVTGWKEEDGRTETFTRGSKNSPHPHT